MNTEIIYNNTNPIRLDRFIREYFHSITQGLIEQALRKQQITVNKLKASASLRIRQNDIITISSHFKFTPVHKLIKNHSTAAKILAAKILDEYKLYDDEHILVINKPAGLAVQGGSKIDLSVNDALEYMNSTASKLDIDYKLCHRLDRATSGLLLIAKNRMVANVIAQAFREQLIKKTYLAILRNIPKVKDGTIQSYLSKPISKHYQSVVEDNINGKIAITKYRVIQLLGAQALVEFKPLTGRMHQLRVHSQSIDCPIVGDSKYGSTGHDTDDVVDRLLLHAYQLTIPANLFNKEYNFIVNTPSYWPNFNIDYLK